MSSEQTQQVMDAQRQTERLSKQAYDIGLPAMKTEFGQINAALGAGEPDYMKSAFAGARTTIMEESGQAQMSGMQQLRRDLKGASEGGNVGAATATGKDVGTSMARALYGARMAEVGSNIEEHDKLVRMAMGQGAQAGSASLQAFGNELATIPMMKNYNQTYANVLGALNLGSSMYGAGRQAGMFDGQYSGAGWSNPSAGVPAMGGVY